MQDCEASFVPNGHLSNMFDTFAFSVPIPVTADSAGVVEFCVCYRHDGEEHWDSNGGKNYRIVSTAKKNPCAVRRVTEAIKADVHSWTEFASWKNLVTEGPLLVTSCRRRVAGGGCPRLELVPSGSLRSWVPSPPSALS
uniref:CBM21 domain-containing protein n=1 Tax=Ixodes ricinus TaxID=34613 RepID=A0A0K8RAL6_IXORI